MMKTLYESMKYAEVRMNRAAARRDARWYRVWRRMYRTLRADWRHDLELIDATIGC